MEIWSDDFQLSVSRTIVWAAVYLESILAGHSEVSIRNHCTISWAEIVSKFIIVTKCSSCYFGVTKSFRLFVAPWTAARRAPLSSIISWSFLKFMPIESVMLSSQTLLPPSPPALNLSQHQALFRWVSSSHQVAKVLEFQLQHQSFQWTPRTDLL